jgi:hypothetical protein
MARKSAEINTAMKLVTVANLGCSDGCCVELLRDALGRQITRPALIVASPL